MNNRRDFLKAAAVVPIAGAAVLLPVPAKDKPAAPEPELRLVGIIPMKAGKVISTTVHRDSVIIATEWGHIYELRATELGGWQIV